MIQLFLFAAALVLAVFLAFAHYTQENTLDCTKVFVLDVHESMTRSDVLSGDTQISRFAAAKHIITTTLLADPSCVYGLVLFGERADYVLPPTFDTGTFLLYLSGIVPYLTSGVTRDFAVLSGVMTAPVSYIILSDFANMSDSYSSLPSSTMLVGLGSSLGLDSRTGDLPYLAVTTIDTFDPSMIAARGVDLPDSQYMLLYILLGILVILGIMI